MRYLAIPMICLPLAAVPPAFAEESASANQSADTTPAAETTETQGTGEATGEARNEGEGEGETEAGSEDAAHAADVQAGANTGATVEPPEASATETDPADAEAGAEADADAAEGPEEAGRDGPAAPEAQPIRRRVAERLEALLREPAGEADAAEVGRRLEAIAANAAELAALSEDPAERQRALTVRMQALYRRVVEFPDAADVPHWMMDLRASARRTKALPPPPETENAKKQTPPEVVGDYWLMLANLVELNRLDLPAAAHRAQARQIMRTFLNRHAGTGLAADVRPAYRDLHPPEKPSHEAAEAEAPDQPSTPD